nr:hypothetical protein [Tanacetum cinerariifolium]
NEQYALWEVIEFSDSYEAPQEASGTGSTSEGSAKKNGRTVAVTTEDMQKRRNDVKARTTLSLALPDEHQLRFRKYKTAKELWAAILKTFGGNKATKKTKKNKLKQQYDNFKEEGSKTLEQTFNRLQAIISHQEFMDVEIEQDDLNQKFLASLAPEWLIRKEEVNTSSIPTASTQVSPASANVAAASISHDTDWSYMANEEEKHALVADEVAPIEFSLMAKSSSSSENKVEARLVEFKNQEIKFCEKIKGLEFNVESKNNTIQRLTNELEELKKEKKGLDSKLIVLFPLPAQVYSPLKKDMSWTRLPEFVDDTITDYSRLSSSIESNSNDLQSSNSSVFKNGESSSSILSKPVITFVNAVDSPTVIKTNKDETVRKSSIKYAKMYRKTSKSLNVEQGKTWAKNNYTHKSRSPRTVFHKTDRTPTAMIGNISYLSNYEPYDRGYVSFGQGGSKITGQGIIKTDKLEFKNVDFKLKDDTNVLLRTPRQHNMYSIDLNNIFPHKDLTCLVTKAFADECMLLHRRLGHLNFKTMNKLVRHNLVRGLPSKCFENDHTCVACLKGKQHKASCKIKFVNSVFKPLHTLHMDLFRPTYGETGGILRNFITEIENLKELKAEAVNTACYVQNRVLRTSSLGKELAQNWLFDIDTLTNSMNYVPVVVAGTSSTNFSSTKDAASQDVKKDMYSLRYIALPNWFHEAHLESSISNAQDAYNTDAPESSENFNPIATSTNPSADHIETLIVESSIPTEEGIDYEEVFAPVTRIEAIRLFLAYASFMGFTVYQMDVKSAFLYESSFDLVAYSDSDYGGATQDQKSTTKGCQFLGRRLISWQCKKQTIVATSTAEAEYVAAASSCNTLEELGLLSPALLTAADEPASLLGDGSQGEAFPTVSGFESRQDRENIIKTSALPHDLTPRVTSLAADEGNKDGGGVEPSGEDATIKRKSLDTGEEAGVEKSTERVSNDTEKLVNVLTSMDAVNILTSGVQAVSVPPVGEIPTVGIPTGSGMVPTASSIFTTASVGTPYSRRKAREIEEQMAREDQRRNEQIAKDAEIARIHAEEELQVMIDGLDRSNEMIAKHLHEYEQAAAELTIGEKIELINELVKYQDHHSKILKYHAQQSKPLSKKQQRDFYMSVLKSHSRWKTKHFKGMSFEEIKEKFILVWKQIKDFVPMASKEEGERFKRKGLRLEQGSAKKMKTSEEVSQEDLKEMMHLVPVEEVYVEALQVKHPINDWEIHSEGQRNYWKIIRLGGSTTVYQFFVDMLKHFDREDLTQLWTLLKETLNIRHATSDKEKELWVDLKSDFVDTPLVEKHKLDEDLQRKLVDDTLYRGMIGSLMYLTFSRPDLTYADTGMSLTSYADAGHAGCQDSRRSTSESAQLLGDKLVSCSSKKQKAKHIDVRYNFIKEQLENGIMELYFVQTEYQMADIFTKPLPRERFNFLIKKLGMKSMSLDTLKRLEEEMDE